MDLNDIKLNYKQPKRVIQMNPREHKDSKLTINRIQALEVLNELFENHIFVLMILSVIIKHCSVFHYLLFVISKLSGFMTVKSFLYEIQVRLIINR